eukprot:403363333
MNIADKMYFGDPIGNVSMIPSNRAQILYSADPETFKHQNFNGMLKEQMRKDFTQAIREDQQKMNNQTTINQVNNLGGGELNKDFLHFTKPRMSSSNLRPNITQQLNNTFKNQMSPSNPQFKISPRMTFIQKKRTMRMGGDTEIMNNLGLLSPLQISKNRSSFGNSSLNGRRSGFSSGRGSKLFVTPPSYMSKINSQVTSMRQQKPRQQVRILEDPIYKEFTRQLSPSPKNQQDTEQYKQKIVYFYQPYVSPKELKLLVDPLAQRSDDPIPLSSLHKEMIKKIIQQDDAEKYDPNKKSVCWQYLTHVITESQEGVVFKKLLKTVKKYKRKQNYESQQKRRRAARFTPKKVTSKKLKAFTDETNFKDLITLTKQMTLKKEPTRLVSQKDLQNKSQNSPDTTPKMNIPMNRPLMMNIEIGHLDNEEEANRKYSNNRLSQSPIKLPRNTSQSQVSSFKSEKSDTSSNSQSKSSSNSKDSKSQLSNFDEDKLKDILKKNLFNNLNPSNLKFKKQLSKRKNQTNFIRKNLSLQNKSKQQKLLLMKQESQFQKENKNEMKEEDSFQTDSDLNESKKQLGGTQKRRRSSIGKIEKFQLSPPHKISEKLALLCSPVQQRRKLLANRNINSNLFNLDILELSLKKQSMPLVVADERLKNKIFTGLQNKIQNHKINEEMLREEPQRRLKSAQKFRYDLLNKGLSPSKLINESFDRKPISEKV